MQSDARTCPLNYDIILLYWMKCTALPTSTPIPLGTESLRFLNGHCIEVKKEGPWVPKGNRG